MCVEIHDILKSELDSAESNSKYPCNLAHRNATSHRCNHLSPALFNACFLTIVVSLPAVYHHNTGVQVDQETLSSG